MRSATKVKSKILAVVLVLALSLTQLLPGLAQDETTKPTIVVSDMTAAPGGKAYVTIGLENNPGIVSMTLGMTFDTSILTLTEVIDAGVFGATSHKPELVSPYTLVWVNDTATENYTVTGTIVTLVFTVSDTAEEEAVSPIEINYDLDQYHIYDKDSQKIEFAIDNGSVTVGEPGPNSIGDFTYEISGTEMIITGYIGVPTDVIIGSKYTVGGVEYTVTEIAAEAFVENEDITSVVIPETVKTIGEYAFYDCLSLTEVTVLSEDAVINELALGYYAVSRKEDGVVEGFTIKGYAGSTAEEYAKADEDITFVALEKVCQHTGGTATCKDKAVCTNCGEPYGELNSANHAGGTEVRGYIAETCSVAGYTGDTYCLGCNTKTADGTTIPASGNHVDEDNDWETNGIQHFHTCACGAEFDKANHAGGTATCKDKAVCSTCGVSYGEKDASNHVGDTYLVGQKETNCYEEGYTGDTYCGSCNVKIADGTTIPKSEHSPASVWSTDDTYHWHECETIGCGNLIDKAEHTGGEATCISKAICSVCKVTYGNINSNNHKNTEVRNATSASCNTAGYTGDTWCKDCETKISDGESIPATGEHVDADNDWESNGTQHFHTCACGTEFDHANHGGGTATCTDKAVCSACGTSYGEKDAANHAGGTYLVNQKEASCYEEGYTGDTYCDGCDVKIADGTTIPKSAHNPASVWSTDETHHWKECVTVGCGNIIDKAEHTGGEATCKDKAICSVCNVAYGETNPSNHKNTEIRDAVKATCSTDGYSGDTWCKDCETKIADGEVILAGHSIEKVPALEPTHEKDGNIEYFICSGCDKLFSNEEATTEIAIEDTIIAKGEHKYSGSYVADNDNHWKACDCGSVIEKAAHTFGEWSVVKQASETEKGSKEKTCTICGHKVTEEIPAVGVEDNEKDDEDAPKTGDMSSLSVWMILLFVSVSCMIVLPIFNKKRGK